MSAEQERPRALPPLLLLLCASGATALAYEVLWARLLGIRFGASILGAAVAVSAFLLGLALGSAWASRRGLAPALALRRFAAIEAAVALCALALPPAWSASAPLFDALAPALAPRAWHALEAACALVALCIPATALGAGFPLALRAARGHERALAPVYSANTLGAALGALLAPGLLYAFGTVGALRAAALAGLLVAAGAAVLGHLRRADDRPGDPGPTDPRQSRGQAPALGQARRLWVYGAVGMSSIVLEISWTRLFGVVLMRTEYVLAIVLAVYLLGTSLGAAIARRWSGKGMLPLLAVLACAGALAGLAALPALGAWAETATFADFPGALLAQALALAVYTLPTTIALGAWLPLLAQPSAAAPDAGRLYAANSLGGALGALLCVLVLLPTVGACASVALAAIALLVLGLGHAHRRLLAGTLPLALAAAAMTWRFPAPARMLPQALGGAQELSRFEDALALQHVVRDRSGQLLLLTDLQHMDASDEPAAMQVQQDQARLALLLHPSPHRILFLGLGTGISAAGSLAWPDLERTAVEISAGAIAAAQGAFAPANRTIGNHMRIVHDDARHFLAADRHQYDVIVGDLFHPDLAGTGGLLSVEQFARARARLAPGGVFVQWVALNQFDVPSAATVLRSFAAVFPDARLYVDAMHLALVGGGSGADARSMRANLSSLPAPAALEATGGEGPMTWLGRYLGPVDVVRGPLESESAPVVEFTLPRLRYEEDFPLPRVLAGLRRARPALARAEADLGVERQDGEGFALAWAGTDLLMRSWMASLGGDAEGARRLAQQAQLANDRDRWARAATDPGGARVGDGADRNALP